MHLMCMQKLPPNQNVCTDASLLLLSSRASGTCSFRLMMPPRPSPLGSKLPRVSRPEASNHVLVTRRSEAAASQRATIIQCFTRFAAAPRRSQGMCSSHFQSAQGESMVSEAQRAVCVCGGVDTYTHPRTSCHLWQINGLCVQGWYNRAHLSLLCTRAGNSPATALICKHTAALQSNY